MRSKRTRGKFDDRDESTAASEPDAVDGSSRQKHSKVDEHSPSRSEFIRNMLITNKSACFQEVAEAWAKLGHTDPIKATLFYLVKFKHSKGGNMSPSIERTNPPISRSKSSIGRAEQARRGSIGDDRTLLEMEQTLDDLIAGALLPPDS